jgi:hypothetical protein
MVLDPIEPGAHNAPEPFRGSLAGKVGVGSVVQQALRQAVSLHYRLYPHPPEPTTYGRLGVGLRYIRGGLVWPALMALHQLLRECFLIDSASILSDRRAESRFDGTMEPAAVGIG